VDAGAFFVGGTACWRKWKGDPDAAPVWFWSGEYDDGVNDLAYQELYTRWMQFAAFLPIFRSHGTDTPRELWHYENVFQTAMAEAIRLRYRFMPYIKEMARRVTEEHYTIMRSLLFDFAYDPNVPVIDNQFMFGDSFLVCPVTEPMYYDKGNIRLKRETKIKSCYLPVGTGWYDYWTNDYFDGGQYVEISASIGIIPLFVRAGSRIPVQEGMQFAEDDMPVSFLDYPPR
jgi:alpha-D-xyloside xylohydrolase